MEVKYAKPIATIHYCTPFFFGGGAIPLKKQEGGGGNGLFVRGVKSPCPRGVLKILVFDLVKTANFCPRGVSRKGVRGGLKKRCSKGVSRKGVRGGNIFGKCLRG